MGNSELRHPYPEDPRWYYGRGGKIYYYFKYCEDRGVILFDESIAKMRDDLVRGRKNADNQPSSTNEPEYKIGDTVYWIYCDMTGHYKGYYQHTLYVDTIDDIVKSSNGKTKYITRREGQNKLVEKESFFGTEKEAIDHLTRHFIRHIVVEGNTAK